MDNDQTLRSMVRDDSYHVERVLAEGPSGRTELVTLDGEGPLVRKRIPVALANAAAWAAVMEVDDPLIPHIESLYRMPEELVVVYDYVEGESLFALVSREGALAPERAVRLVRDVCHAAGVLHQCGIVHRDITPGNVIVAPDGRAHLTDLGIARHEAPHKAHDTRVLGTLGFAAPEQFGFAQSDARSDVFAMGRLLGYVLSGLDPSSEQYEATLTNSALVPAALAAVVARATSFEPSARYQSAHELDEALSTALDTSFHVRAERNKAPVRSFTLNNPAPSVFEPNEPARRKAPETQDVRAAIPATQSYPAAYAASSGADTAASAGAAASAGTAAGRSAAMGTSTAAGTTAVAGAGSARSNAARPTPRSSSKKSFWRIIAAILFWGNALFWIIMIILSIYDSITKGKPAWGPAQYAMGVALGCGIVSMTWEVHQTIMHRGAYAQVRHPLYRLLQRILIICGIVFVLMMVAIAALPHGN